MSMLADLAAPAPVAAERPAPHGPELVRVCFLIDELNAASEMRIISEKAAHSRQIVVTVEHIDDRRPAFAGTFNAST